MPDYYAPMNFQYDRQSANVMISALSYTPPLDQTAYASSLEQEREQRKAAKAKKAYLASDAASVSSFSSTVSLLKSKFSRKDKLPRQEKDKKRAQKVLRSQMTIVG